MWGQRGRILTMTYPQGKVTWQMPRGFRLENIHSDLLVVATHTLLSPWYSVIPDDWKPSRVHGRFPGLSFSGGIDSTACFLLMPKD